MDNGKGNSGDRDGLWMENGKGNNTEYLAKMKSLNLGFVSQFCISHISGNKRKTKPRYAPCLKSSIFILDKDAKDSGKEHMGPCHPKVMGTERS